VRDLGKIKDHYLKTCFLSDFLPLIPLQFLDLPKSRENLFLIIKTYRMLKGLKLLDIGKIMIIIRK
jgi:hypothetical protein